MGSGSSLFKGISKDLREEGTDQEGGATPPTPRSCCGLGAQIGEWHSSTWEGGGRDPCSRESSERGHLWPDRAQGDAGCGRWALPLPDVSPHHLCTFLHSFIHSEQIHCLYPVLSVGGGSGRGELRVSALWQPAVRWDRWTAAHVHTTCTTPHTGGSVLLEILTEPLAWG